MLEAFHGQPNLKALEKAWPYLNDDDYHLRYAARIAIESGKTLILGMTELIRKRMI